MRIVRSLLAIAPLFAADPPAIHLYRVASGFEMPLDIRFPPDGSGRMFVVEQRGRIRIVENGAVLSGRPFLDLRAKVSCCGERGLLGLVFSPSFGGDRTFYINYTDLQGNSVVSRMRLADNPHEADASSEEIILRVAQPYANHNGGNLHLGPDGYLFTWDSVMAAVQEIRRTMHSARMRCSARCCASVLNLTRRHMECLPITHSSTTTRIGRRSGQPDCATRGDTRSIAKRRTCGLPMLGKGARRRSIFNPQPAEGRRELRMAKDRGTRCYPPGSTCDRTGTTLPILEYGRTLGQSVTGGFVYRGSRYPDLRGFYLYGDFGSGNLWAVQRQGSSWDNRLVLATGRQISTFGEDETGELYLADYRGDLPDRSRSACHVNEPAS